MYLKIHAAIISTIIMSESQLLPLILQSAESFSSVDGSEKEEVMLQGKDVKTLPSYGCIFETIELWLAIN